MVDGGEMSDSSLVSFSCANAFFMLFTSLSSFLTLAWLELSSSSFGQCVDECPGVSHLKDVLSFQY
jgi:hypothetical protein